MTERAGTGGAGAGSWYKAPMRTPHRPIVLVATALGLGLLGCKQLGPLGDALAPYTPKLRFDKLELRAIDFTKVDVDFMFKLENPNPLSVKLDTFSYALGLEGVEFVKGTNADGLKLESRGESDLAIPVSLTYQRIFELVQNTKGKDDLGFSIAGDLGFNTPVGMAKVPFREEGRFPVVRAPGISLKGLRMGKVDLLKQKASMNLDLGFSNPDGGQAVSFAGFDFGVDMAGSRVASGVREDIPAVTGGGEQLVSLPIDLDLKSVGKTLVTAITGKKAIDVKLGGKVQVGTPFGKIPLTFDQLASLIPL